MFKHLNVLIATFKTIETSKLYFNVIFPLNQLKILFQHVIDIKIINEPFNILFEKFLVLSL